jgi:hypothetical protein
MSIAPASAPASLAPDLARRLLAAWVAEQAQRLPARERDALDLERPGWRAQAAQLIAEGLLAYVVLEMVAPDLAIAAASGGPVHGDDDALTERLTAHLQDFIDYRDELVAHGGLAIGSPDGAAEHTH